MKTCLRRQQSARDPEIDASRLERVVQKTPGRTDERQPLPILVIARLLADQQEPRVRRARAEHGLRRPLPQRTGATVVGRRAQASSARAPRPPEAGAPIGQGVAVNGSKENF
jgi:hypothetical protein